MYKFWSGKSIDSLKPNEVFVFGSNPEGRHGMGSAKAAYRFGAKYGQGRGLSGQTYALVTKNLKCGYIERSTGIQYLKIGNNSVTLNQIRENIKGLFKVADEFQNIDFLVTYQRGSKPLSGWLPEQIIELFLSIGMPRNIVLHDSFQWRSKHDT
tara:strand:- start:18562 stop:19023 length:462 start_codon:yes stop_codon:yes gene_type:complete